MLTLEEKKMKAATWLVIFLVVVVLLVDQQNTQKSQTSSEVYSNELEEQQKFEYDYLQEKNLQLLTVLPISDAIEVGAKAVVPDWQWVTTLEDSSKCGIQMGGVLTIEAVEDEELLVSYEFEGETAGTPCESGVQFWLSRDEFAAMNSQYAQKRNAIIAKQEIVSKILAQNFYGEVYDAGNWHWVEVENLVPVSNGNIAFAYGDNCGCGRVISRVVFVGGKMQVRGEHEGMVLYQYTSNTSTPFGTQCPTGVLFFGPKI